MPVVERRVVEDCSIPLRRIHVSQVLREYPPLAFRIGDGGLENAPWAFAGLLKNGAFGVSRSRQGCANIRDENLGEAHGAAELTTPAAEQDNEAVKLNFNVAYPPVR
jgi:hypothetical protein